MQGAAALLGELGLQPGPHLRVGAGEVEGVDGAAYVQAGAADEDGGAALGEQAVDLGAGQPLVLGDVRGPGHVPDVQEVVRDAVALGHRQLGGADVHSPVELHGVGVDDFATEMAGERDAQIGLSGRGGTDDGDDPGYGNCGVHRPSLANPRGASRTSDVTARLRVRCLLRGSGRRFTDRGPRAAQWDAPGAPGFRPHE